MPLNENEERILHEIERRFYAHDPASAHRIESTTLPKYLARNCKWASFGFLAGLVVLVVGFASSWIVGVFGFAVMLVSAIVLTQNLRKMGRHGIEQFKPAWKGYNLGEALADAVRRFRKRFDGDT
ncbi:MAG: DUF3040 domain-containing protein [Acidimicrobiales bacterium]